MRIRKNAKLSPLMFSQGSSGAQPLQTHVCQLNQSPWDVISFSKETYCPSSSLYQLEGEDSLNGNGSLGDSVGAVESVASMMMGDSEEKGMMKMKVDRMVILDDNYENEGNKRSEMFGDYEEMKIDSEFKLKKCNKTDGKGWHCKNDTKNGHTVCDNHHHHLTSLKSSYSNINDNINGSTAAKKPDKVTSITGARRGRAKSAKRGSSSNSNPYEFYYYSGFGPLWGKRRGDRDAVNKNEAKDVDDSTVIGSMIPNTTPSSSYSPIENNQGFDYVDDDDDDEEEDSGKKRMRKPVKARSLKSLM
ncbi:major centromere autoantigen [Salix suchowensis]|nr:major centromere autoantigen [Salix suchowensis]